MSKFYQEVEGDLIKLAKEGAFDVIAHGCNCFCTMGAGIAPQIAKAFGADEFPLEARNYIGSINKLGMIDVGKYYLPDTKQLSIINAYTQFSTNKFHGEIPLDYDAIRLCMKKINHRFPGRKIGLPQIGCGLAGGDWEIVKEIIQTNLKDMIVTVVIYKP